MVVQSTSGISTAAYLEQTAISNKTFGPLAIFYQSHLKNCRYLEPRYLERFAISNKIIAPMSYFCPVSRTFVIYKTHILRKTL